MGSYFGRRHATWKGAGGASPYIQLDAMSKNEISSKSNYRKYDMRRPK